MPRDRNEDISSRMRRRWKQVEDATERGMRELEKTGGLRHMHGKPLELNDDPDWLIARVLKQAGFSHPLIERRKEMLEPLDSVAPTLERLPRRRAWLRRRESRARIDDVVVFNSDRGALLREYRAKTAEVNRAIRDFNLSAPESLQERALSAQAIVDDVEERLPVLGAEIVQDERVNEARSWWERMFRRN
jgi:hypothetical protein